MPSPPRHLNIDITGLVQGVGFRPFVFRLAREHQQHGWICNRPAGVALAIEGDATAQEAFLQDLNQQLPPFATIETLSVEVAPLTHYDDFRIIHSELEGQPSCFVLPDLAPCADCLEELRSPDSRFHRYPFVSCSYCGPRYSIMRELPYDRQRTSMAGFKPCPRCEHDYRSPDNRRFHAQTIACAECGPILRLHDGEGTVIATAERALNLAISALERGEIIALQGVGGFQLLVDAGHSMAVERLRLRKQRPDKPLALLVANLEMAESLCVIDDSARKALMSSAAPILLLPRRDENRIAAAVAPNNRMLGLMLPASPLHHLLAQDFGKPLVATSGNRHNEPLCHEATQAFSTLKDIADHFLIHDRAIVRPLDDSIVRIIAGQATVLRRARGYAPLTIATSQSLTPSLALGGQWKSSIAISHGRHIIASQHLGDLDAEDSQRQFLATQSELQRFYGLTPQRVIHDGHPDYVSSRLAQQHYQNTMTVQHHCAHVFACMAEHDLEPPVLGIAWDGSGLGDDGQIGGSECLLIDDQGYQRLAHFKPMAQPGGDQSARQPRRSALAILTQLFGDELPNLACQQGFDDNELRVLKQMLAKNLNCPTSSSAGRLFDAVASLLNLCHINRFEGQAAMMLEQIAEDSDAHYPFKVSDRQPAVIDWAPMLRALIDDLGRCPKGMIAGKFHNTLARMILDIALRAGQSRIVLSGGCFQNARLTETTTRLLEAAGFEVYRHKHIPPNDGGLAVGQLYAAHWLRKGL